MNIKDRMAGSFRRTLTRISPMLNTKVTYYVKFHKKLDLAHPVTLNDKILWLKFNTYWENPLIKLCADKYRVREYITERGFKELLNPIIGVYDDVEAIQWSNLPDKFAIKLNMGCGCNIIVSDKKQMNLNVIKETLKKWMKSEYYLDHSEMQYKDVKHYIIIENYLGKDNGDLPEDYKFYCMNGECKAILLCVNRDAEGHALYFFMDRNWNVLPYTWESEKYSNLVPPKPKNLDLAINNAEALAKEFPFVRVDFYFVNNEIVFGELTFTPAGGMDRDLKYLPPHDDKDVDHILGEMLCIDD